MAILAAPTNLGLRPPVPSAVPGCAKAPEALRAAGLYRRLPGAVDGGVVLAPRYVDDKVPGSLRLRNHDALLNYTTRVAGRLAGILDAATTPLVIGGDCSLLLAAGQALAARGRYGLVHLDGHTDFRHPGNSPECASLAGEDLAAAVGLHWPDVSRHGGRPHFRATDVVHVGARPDDEGLPEAAAVLPLVVTADRLHGATGEVAAQVRAVVDRADLDGYWLHLDVDVLDPSVMPAVDSPAPGGLSPAELTELLALLAPRATGAHVTVFDPDLDPDGRHAGLLVEILSQGFARLGRDRLGRDAHPG